jgi:hypothetical protein
MVKRSMLFWLLAGVVFAAVWLGCSSGSSTSHSAVDSGRPMSSGGGQDSGTQIDSSVATDSRTSSTDTSTTTSDSEVTTETGSDADADTDADAGESGAIDSAPFDSAVPVIPPAATPLVTGDNLEIWGITGDEYIIYSDETAGVLYSLSLTADAGAPETVMTMIGAAAVPDGGHATHSVLVNGNVVFISTGLDSSGVGSLYLWTSSATAPTMVAASAGSGGLVTADNAHVAFIANVNESTKTADFVEETPTGTGKTTLLSGLDLSGNNVNCTLSGATATSLYFILNYCLASPADAAADAATPPVTISEFAVATGQRTDLLSSLNTDTSGFALNPANTQLLVAGDRGLVLITLAATPPTPKVIDSHATGTAVFTPDGTAAIYLTPTNGNSGGLFRAPVTASIPAPLQLQPNFIGLDAVSPDGTLALGFENIDEANPMASNFGDTDLWLAPSSTAATATSIVSGTTAQLIGDAFTSDSSHVLYENLSGSASTLEALAVTGTAPVVLAQSPVSVFAAGTLSSEAGTGTAVVVFNANPYPSTTISNGNGTADIYTVDTSMIVAPNRVVSQANADFALTTTRNAIVYAWNVQAGPKAGLYVATVP